MASLTQARSSGFAKYQLAALTNLGVLALYADQLPKSRSLLNQVIPSYHRPHLREDWRSGHLGLT